MKKNITLVMFTCLVFLTSQIKADLFYDIYNTTNKNIRVVFFPTNNEEKRQASVNLAPGETKKNYQYYNYVGTYSYSAKPTSWGVKQIMIIDLDTNKFMSRDIKKDLQKEFLKITVSYSDNIGTKGSEKPMGLWFDYSKKKS